MIVSSRAGCMCAPIFQPPSFTLEPQGELSKGNCAACRHPHKHNPHDDCGQRKQTPGRPDPLVDLVELHVVRDVLVQQGGALHVVLHQLGDLGGWGEAGGATGLSGHGQPTGGLQGPVGTRGAPLVGTTRAAAGRPAAARGPVCGRIAEVYTGGTVPSYTRFAAYPSPPQPTRTRRQGFKGQGFRVTVTPCSTAAP